MPCQQFEIYKMAPNDYVKTLGQFNPNRTLFAEIKAANYK